MGARNKSFFVSVMSNTFESVMSNNYDNVFGLFKQIKKKTCKISNNGQSSLKDLFIRPTVSKFDFLR